MSDASTRFSDDLMGMKAPEVSNASLNAMAQSAVDLMEKEGCSLSSAICKTASQDPGLSNEHLRRITEMANTTTHLRQLNAGDTYPVFDLADYRDVWKNLEKSAGIAVQQRSTVSADFLMPPKRKLAMSLDGVVEPELVTKEAAADQLLNLSATLREAHSQLQARADYYQGEADIARIKLANEIRTHLLNDGVIEDVASLALQGGKWEKVAFAGAVGLLEEGQKKEAFDLEELGRGAVKAIAPVAHLADDVAILGMSQYNRSKRKQAEQVKVSSIRVPNPEHPLAKALAQSAELEKQAAIHQIAAQKTERADLFGAQLLDQAREL